MSNTDIKEVVEEKYGQAALRVKTGGSASCCGTDSAANSGCGCVDPMTANLYDSSRAGQIPEEALLASLGCGNPTALAQLKPGETVLDLGSGGGSNTPSRFARRQGWIPKTTQVRGRRSWTEHEERKLWELAGYETAARTTDSGVCPNSS